MSSPVLRIEKDHLPPPAYNTPNAVLLLPQVCQAQLDPEQIFLLPTADAHNPHISQIALRSQRFYIASDSDKSDLPATALKTVF